MPRTRPTLTRRIGRALTLRCPQCANRRTFLRGWFRRYDRCRTCGISWRREEGFELGAVTVNTVVTMFVLVVAMAVSLIATLPNVPVTRVVVLLGAAGILIPILIYPFTYTLWLAFDLAVHPPGAAEIEDGRRAISPGEVHQP